MELRKLGEDALVARLTRRAPLGPHVVMGPGDDCAVVKVRRSKSFQLLKTDCVVEGVHFLRGQPADRVGWKALCRAISDVAACGGEPDTAMITIAAPGDLDARYLETLMRGIHRAARAYGVSIVGGETAASPAGIFISVSLTGWVKPKRLVLRSGGRADDAILVSGRLGGSLGGRHLTFAPRVAEARWLVGRFAIHAMMDLSDGLGTDLPRLADASRKGFAVDIESIPRARGCTVGQAISDGEDYELLFTTDSATAAAIQKRWRRQFPRVPLTRIGSLAADRRARTPLTAGYSHFSGCQSAGKSG